MKTYPDCTQCFVRQALEAVRFVSDDPAVHERVQREVSRLVAEMPPNASPPVMGQQIHRLIRTLAGDDDPYRAAKEASNRVALEMCPQLRKRLGASPDPVETAIRLAIAGNVIDFGVRGDLRRGDIERAVADSLTDPLIGDPSELAEATDRARSILYLADNAGELVFDRLLIEQLPLEKVTLAVRGGAVINDATMSDARAAGLDELIEVIDNGSDAPGTILDDCRADFRRRFRLADLVIAKGQGNYETLSEAAKDIWFLLKAKCPVIATALGCSVGAMVLRRSDASAMAA